MIYKLYGTETFFGWSSPNRILDNDKSLADSHQTEQW